MNWFDGIVIDQIWVGHSKICNEIVRLLREKGHKAYNCTVSNGISQRDVLKKICTKCNKTSSRHYVSNKMHDVCFFIYKYVEQIN